MLPSLADLDLERLSPAGRETLQTIAIPKADEDLTDEAIAERLGLTRRQVAGSLAALAEELRAQRDGAVLPDLHQDEYDALKDSIQQLGQLEPVVLAGDGSVIDGRHRLRACEDLGIEPWHVVLDGPSDRTSTLAANAVRRQLSSQQKERLASAELVYDSTRSDRRIAAVIGVSHPFVARVRRNLERLGDVETVSTRTDALGREQPAKEPTVEWPGAQSTLDEAALADDGLPPVSDLKALPAGDPQRLYVDENLFDALGEVALLAGRYYANHGDEYPNEELEEALTTLRELREAVSV